MEDKIAIVTSGFLPVPATKGGAVENLIVNIMNVNEKEKKENFLIYSVYEKKAVKESQEYKETEFKFIRINCLTKLFDIIVHFIAKNILRKKNSQSYRYILQRIYYLNEVSKDLRKNDYKKVILENHPTQYLCLKWRKNYIKYDGRYYYHCHNEFPGEYGCHDVIKNTKKVICVSNYIKKFMKQFINDDKKLVVLRNGIDTAKFKEKINKEEKEKIFEKYKIDKNDAVLLYAGRIVPEKGVLELIEAIKKVKNTNFKLLIVGSSLNDFNNKTEYEEIIEQKLEKVKDKVIFTGFIKYEEMNKIYQIANISIIPSIGNDAAPLTIIEALVCGMPIITTNSGGIPEYAINDSAVILERNENLVNNLANTIDELLNNKERLAEMSKNAKKISKELNKETYYENFINIICK